MSARSVSTESRFDSRKLRMDNGKLRPSVARSAEGEESTKCREIEIVKRKECVEKFILGEINKYELCRRFQVRKECVRVKLRRDSNKDPKEKERYVESREVTIGILSEGIEITDSR